MSYFIENLNYTLSNEDTNIEFELLQENAASVFTIGGSGARVLPLIARNPQEIDVIDISQAQLYLVELKYAAVKALSYEEYLFFMGYRASLQSEHIPETTRVDIFKKIKLSQECQEFWQTRVEGWKDKGFILLGKWESHFQKLGVILRKYLRLDMSQIFKASTLQEQKEIYDKTFNKKLFKAFLRLAASDFVFNKFLYKGHFSGSKEKRSTHLAPWKFIYQEFDRVFSQQLLRKNYFFQILFLGEIRYEEGLPLADKEFIFNKVKASNTKVNYICGDLLEALKTKAWSFVSLSDTISYLPDEAAKNILQTIPEATATGSKVVIRGFLRSPDVFNIEGWSKKTELEMWSYQVDGTAIYHFHIFEKQHCPPVFN